MGFSGALPYFAKEIGQAFSLLFRKFPRHPLGANGRVSVIASAQSQGKCGDGIEGTVLQIRFPPPIFSVANKKNRNFRWVAKKPRLGRQGADCARNRPRQRPNRVRRPAGRETPSRIFFHREKQRLSQRALGKTREPGSNNPASRFRPEIAAGLRSCPSWRGSCGGTSRFAGGGRISSSDIFLPSRRCEFAVS